MKSLFSSYFVSLLILMSCGVNDVIDPDNNVSTFDCDNLISALLDLDAVALQPLVDAELKNFTLLDQDNNTCPHDNNLQAYSDLLNDNCNTIEASIICCGCIETFPTISEIAIVLDSVGTEVQRVLDLKSPLEEGMPLTFDGVHE